MQIDSLESSLNGQKRRYDELKQTHEDLVRKFNEETTQSVRTADELSRKTEELKQATFRLSSVEMQLSGVKSTMKDESDESRRLRLDFESAARREEQLRNDVEKVKEEKEALEARLLSLESQVRNESAARQASDERANGLELQSSAGGLKRSTSYGTGLTEGSEWREKYETANAKIAELKASLRSIQAENIAAMDEAETTRQRLASENEKLKAEVQSTRFEIANRVAAHEKEKERYTSGSSARIAALEDEGAPLRRSLTNCARPPSLPAGSLTASTRSVTLWPRRSSRSRRALRRPRPPSRRASMTPTPSRRASPSSSRLLRRRRRALSAPTRCLAVCARAFASWMR